MNRIQILFPFALLLGALHFPNCQSGGAKKPKPGASVEEVATIYVNSMLEHDVETYAAYVIPQEIEKAGGLEKMRELIKKDAEYYKGQGVTLSNGKVDRPSAISKCNGESQCVLRQQVTWEWKEMGTGTQKKAVVESNLVAISKDDGANWKFLSVGGQDLATVRLQFPNLCADLVFPKYGSTGQ